MLPICLFDAKVENYIPINQAKIYMHILKPDTHILFYQKKTDT